MKKNWSSKKGTVNQKRQDYIDTGFTTCPIHGRHNRWKEQLIKGCPCLYCRDCINTRDRKRSKTKPIHTRLKYAKTRARQFNREFDLTVEYIEFLLAKQNNKCALSGIVFENEGQFSFSLDRIDSYKGYTKENTQLVCQVVNTMKMDTNQDLFLQICKQIALNNE